jgi:hypothetical protein
MVEMAAVGWVETKNGDGGGCYHAEWDAAPAGVSLMRVR